MTNTAIRDTGTQKIQVGRALYGSNQAGTEQGGDFLVIMLQQLAGMSGTDAVGSILAQMQDTQMTQEDEEQNGNELAMQMLAELFLPNLPTEDLLKQTSAVGLVQQQTGQSPLSGILQQLSPAVQQELRELEGTKGKPMQALFQEALDGSQEGTDAVQVISVAQTSEKETTLLGGESQFQNSVTEALKLIKAQRKDEQKNQFDMIDVDKMQQEVNAGKFNNATAVHKASTPLLDSKDLIAQLQTGIQEHISNGKNEFVVKLKPEGLGEITIKMSELDNKISLSIITSSTQAARALSGELTALRESLRLLNADVHEVITQSQSAFNAAQNEQFGQNYQGHQHQQFNRQGSSLVFSQPDEMYAENSQGLPDSLELASGLDTYI
ncbi:flagellar hook-length control protein FliK [Oscillospiraceae bacterium PP1C4]